MRSLTLTSLRQCSTNMVRSNLISQENFDYAVYIYEKFMWDKIQHLTVFINPNIIVADILYRTKNLCCKEYRTFKGKKGLIMRKRLDIMWYLTFGHLYTEGILSNAINQANGTTQ